MVGQWSLSGSLASSGATLTVVNENREVATLVQPPALAEGGIRSNSASGD